MYVRMDGTTYVWYNLCLTYVLTYAAARATAEIGGWVRPASLTPSWVGRASLTPSWVGRASLAPSRDIFAPALCAVIGLNLVVTPSLYVPA